MTDWLIGVVVAAILAVVVAAILAVAGWAAYAENDKWQRFKAEHSCKIVGKRADKTAFGTDTKGQFTTTVIPGETGWLCDDGVTYWR